MLLLSKGPLQRLLQHTRMFTRLLLIVPNSLCIGMVQLIVLQAETVAVYISVS